MDRVGDDHRRVAEDVRSPRADVVDVGLAIDVLDAAAMGLADEERFAADIAERAHRRVHPTGDQGFGDSEKFLRERTGRVHGRKAEQKFGSGQSGITVF